MSAHSPGPWRATFDRDWRGYMVRDTRGHEIAAVKWPWPPETKYDHDDVMYEANALLIAAAPEMLTLLQRAEFLDGIQIGFAREVRALLDRIERGR